MTHKKADPPRIPKGFGTNKSPLGGEPPVPPTAAFDLRPVSWRAAGLYYRAAMKDVLREIVDHKRTEVDQAKSTVPPLELERRLADAPPVRGFAKALAARNPMALIAEVKRASPSAGVIRGDIDPVALAVSYERFGAACLSVLTDQKFFHGSLGDLIKVRQAVSIPILRKDFLIDRYQVLEARAAGADCVLLIAECLDHCPLRELYFYASELGMDALVEIYDAENLDRVLELEPALVGINNRNLRTFETDLERTLRLALRIAPPAILVSESGIRTGEDVSRLQAAGVRAILVGETLMRADDLAATMSELLVPRPTTESQKSRP